MGDENNRRIGLAAEQQQVVLHLGASEGIQGGERLVHEKDRRFNGHTSGNGDPRLHPARQGMGKGVRELRKTDPADEIPGLFHRASASKTDAVGQCECHVLRDREPGQQLVEFLEDHHPVGARLHDLTSRQPNASLGGTKISADGFQESRFAAARRSEQDVTVAGENFEADPESRGHMAPIGFVPQGQAADLEQRWRCIGERCHQRASVGSAATIVRA